MKYPLLRYLFAFSLFMAFTAFVLAAAPTISSTSPATNALNVTATANLTVTFDQAMTNGTLNANTIKVHGNYRGFYSAAFSVSGNTVTINPDSSFKAGEVITVTVTTGVQNASNEPMASPRVYNFTVDAPAGYAKFSSPVNYTAYGTGSGNHYSVLADLDKDGDIDIASTTSLYNIMSVMLNNGNGTFASAVTYNTANAFDISAADVDGDGDMDLAVANNNAFGISVFVNNGSGSFSTRNDYAFTFPQSNAQFLVTVDIDGDGDIDIVASDLTNNYLHVMKNNGSGAFTSSGTDYEFTTKLGALSYGDLDKDGDMDILATCSSVDSVELFANNGNGTLSLQTRFYWISTDGPTATLIADINSMSGDKQDLVWLNGSTDLLTYFKDGSGVPLFTADNVAVGGYPIQVNAADVDADNDLDLMVANYNDATFSLLTNTGSGTGTFTTTHTYTVPDNPDDMSMADLDGDGDLDAVTINNDATVSVFRNYNGGHVASVTPSNGSLDISASSNIVIVFDENINSGTLTSSTVKLIGSVSGVHAWTLSSYVAGTYTATINPTVDFAPGEAVSVVVSNGVQSSVNINLEKGYSAQFVVAAGNGAAFVANTDYAAGTQPNGIILADLNADGDADLVAVNSGSDNVSVRLNNGDGTFGSETLLTTGDNPSAVASGDVDGDGDVDLVVTVTGADQLARFLNNGSGSFGAAATFSTAASPTALSLGDIDTDGDLDVVYISSGQGRRQTNNGSGAFSDEYGFSSAHAGIVVADVNNDGDLDVIYTYDNSIFSNVTVYNNSGTGVWSSLFTGSGSYTLGYSPTGVIACDFNNDGYVDVVTTGLPTNGTISYLQNNQNGTFASKVDYSVATSAQPRGLSAADIDGDGDLDIVVANGAGDNAKVFINNGSGVFSNGGEFTTGDNPYAIASADVNGDGLMDIATANYGGGSVSVKLNGLSAPIVTTSAATSVTSTGATLNGTVNALNLGTVTRFAYKLNSAGSYAATDTITATPTGFAGGANTSISAALTGLLQNTMYNFKAIGVNSVGTTEGSALNVTTLEDALAVSSTIPSANALDVASNANITATFNISVEEDSLNTRNVFVFGSMSGRISGVISYDDPSKTMTFNPTNNFKVGEIVTLTLTDNIASNSALSFNSTHSTSFTVASAGTGQGFFVPDIVEGHFQNGEYQFIPADVDNDGDADLVGYTYYAGFSVSKNNAGTFDAPVLNNSVTDIYRTIFADMDNDGDGDLVIQRVNNSTYAVILSNNGSGVFTLSDSINTGSSVVYYCTEVNDFNNDGKKDIVTYPNGGTQVKVWFNAPGWSNNYNYAITAGDHRFASGDIDNDGDIDLIAADNGTIKVIKNNGNQTFASAVSYSFYSGYTQEVVMRDFNGDGYLDVMTMGGNDAHTLGINLNNGDGTLGTVATYTLGIQPANVSAGDMDGDGDVDLAFVYQNETSLNVAYNNGSGVFSQQALFNVRMPGITMMDIDGDGDLDIAGNSYLSASNLIIAENTIPTAPTTDASSVNFTNNYGSTVKITWTNGNGTNRIVVVKEGSAVNANPADNTSYSANAAFGSGAQLGSGNYVVYNGTGNTVMLTGLSLNTAYHISVFEYNGLPGGELYATSTPGTGSVVTSSVDGFPFDTTAGYAFRYNNNGYSSSNNALEIPDGFTYEIWAKPSSVGSQMVILDHGEEYMWIALDATGKFFGRIYDDNASSNIDITGTTTAVAGQWYHLALTGASGSPLKLYVNGVLEATSGGTIGALVTGDQWLYPATDYFESYYFSGDLDELRIWSTVRTVEQIRTNMHKTLSGTSTPLVGYWQFNEGTGNTSEELVNENPMSVGDAAWVASSAPVGGAVISSTTAFQNGTTTVGNATLNMANGFDNPVDVYVSEVSDEPSNYPTGFGSSIGGKYFVINLFGDPGTFSTNITFTFGPGAVTAGQESDPSTVRLYKRESNSAGSWTDMGGASTAVASTGAVTWTGITSFSQFIAIDLNDELPPTLTVTKADGADWTLAENQDRISDNVWLTREDYGVLFNIKTEESYDNSSPAGTEWAMGTIADDVESLTFDTFRNLRDADGMDGSLVNLPGKDAVLHLIDEDIYLDVHFNSWSSGGDGGFSYTRSLKQVEAFADGLNTPTSITPTSATLKGRVYSKVASASVYFVYGTASGVYTDSVIATPGTIPLDTIHGVTATLTGLTASDTVYYRIGVWNGTHYGRSVEQTVVPHEVQVWSKNDGTISFTKSDNVDHTLPEHQDRISSTVALTRNTSYNGIFNIHSESSYNNGSPAGTKWAMGTTADIASLTFTSWDAAINSDPVAMVGQDMVMHLTEEDIYLDVKFTSWSGGGGGGDAAFMPDDGFAYDRAAAPLISWTTAATSVAYTSATLNGKVFSRGLTASAYILYGTSIGVYTDSVAVTPGSISSSTLTSVSAGLTSLTEWTTYYYCIAASNASYYKRSAAASFQTGSSTIGNALKFDGNNDYVSVNTGASTMTAPFTIEAWLNPATTSGTNCFFDSRSPNEHGIDIKLQNGNQIHADIGDGSGWLTTSADASYNYSAGTWIHVAYVVTTTGYTIYVDGTQVGSGSFSGTPLLFDTNHNVKIGSQGGGGEFFNGIIEDMRVWSVARTQQQIQSNMHIPFAGPQSGLVSNWQFNETSGTNLDDFVGSYDGTLNNFNFNETDGWVLSSTPLPVELVSFTAVPNRLNAELKWKTAMEVNNHGFEIERSLAVDRSPNVTASVASKEWTKVGFVEGSGTVNAPKEYVFTDKVQKPGKYSYRLKQVDRDGKFTYSSSVEVTVGAVPLVFALEQNYPNPFNPTTTIGFTLEQSGLTTLKIYDIVGREVATLVNEVLQSGEYHQKQFNAGNLASGVYFARLVSGSKVQVKKLMLMK